MSNAISINIGLNHVDPDQYNGWDGQLSGCVNDALAMRKIADDLGYVSTMILDEEATADRIISEIGQAAWNLDENGIVLISFSGHGGQMTDANGDESDGLDETWVCYDRQLIDDELYNLWNQFASGARILVISDSCHSGTVTRGLEYQAVVNSSAFSKHYQRSRSGPLRFRGIPPEVAAGNYEANKTHYRSLQFASGSRTRSAMEACVMLLSGCQDNQLSSDGDSNGLFTGNLLTVWNSGAFGGDYRAFLNAICDRMPSTQTPNYSIVGTPSEDFEAQSPFSVETTRTQEPNGSGASDVLKPIEGPAVIARDAQPPSFAVHPGSGRYYAVEVAAQADLFDSSDVSDSNFYGSWSDTSLMRASTYSLPQQAWARLRNADQLFYRIASSTSATGWTDFRVSGNAADDSLPAIHIMG
jgi:hypothetical protein